MIVCISENLRRLRKAEGMTQEELANRLQVSAQAISKWERNESYPDILMLPRLAKLFGVSVDALMGIEEVSVEEEYRQYNEVSDILISQGKLREALALWEQAHERFPQHVGTAIRLMDMLAMLADTPAMAKRLISLGETLLEQNTLSKHQRDRVLCHLVRAFADIGENEKVRHIALGMNYLSQSAEILLANHLEGKEGKEQAQYTISYLVRVLHDQVLNVCRKGNYTPVQRVRAWKSCIRIYEAVYEDEDYGAFSHSLATAYRELASAYARLFDRENTLTALEKRCELVLHHLLLPQRFSHTSPLVEGTGHLTAGQGYFKGKIHNIAFMMRNGLAHEMYDFIRDDPRFLRITEALDKVAR